MNITDREAIIEASAKIKELREAVNQAKQGLSRQETVLDRLLSGLQPQAASSTDAVPSANGAKSLNQRMIDLLNGSSDRQFTAEDVFAALPHANLMSIRSGLARLADQEKIRRVDRGQYQGIERVSASEVQERVVS